MKQTGFQSENDEQALTRVFTFIPSAAGDYYYIVFVCGGGGISVFTIHFEKKNLVLL